MAANSAPYTPHQSTPPKTGWAGFKANWKADMIAGFSVSLIALPLCLGIARASEFPAIAGVLTAIMGGLIASRLCGSFVTISGPAAGLIAINVAAVTTLGGTELDPVTQNAIGYPFALAAIVVAGLFVMLFGLLKVGKLSDFFPTAAVHGMLAAIGIIIIIKQFFPAIGVVAPKGELVEMIMEMPRALMEFNPLITLVGAMGLAVLLIYPRIKSKWVKMVPAPMWVLLMAIPMAFLFDFMHGHSYTFMGNTYELNPMRNLVQLPDRITDGIVFPDFGKAGTGAFWIAVATIAIVSGLESLLSAKAVDQLDPWRRQSNLNKDLIALGAGSSAAAAIGGLPMISEIVRSSANINNGARTPWANFFHGAFLLVFLFLLKPLIMDIPNAALAAMLIFTGFRLASPKEFKHMAEIGWRQMVVFLSTIVMVIAVDLLVGIFAGIVVELILNAVSGGSAAAMFKAHVVAQEAPDGTVSMRASKSLTFTNYLSLKRQLNKYPIARRIVLDVSDCTLIDHTVLSNLESLAGVMRLSARELEIQGLEALKPVAAHALAPRRAVAGYAPEKLAVATTMNARTEGLQAFANHRGYTFASVGSKQAAEEWTGFAILQGKTIDAIENVVTGPQFVVSELTFTAGALITAEENRRTFLRVTLSPGVHVPQFALLRETNFDKVAEKFGAQDIDFDDFPVFSDKFLLVGQDEASIRAHFSATLLRYHEEYPEYLVESRGDALLIYIDNGLLGESEVAKLVDFATGLVARSGMPTTNA